LIYLATSYIIIRLVLCFVVVELYSYFFNKKSFPDSQEVEYTFQAQVAHSLTKLHSFDAEHFLHVAKSGYTHEKNHAFFPLFPMVIKLVL